ncbi:ATP-dependent Clp protease ATP-binding subunit clpC [Hordeum vulgare]|nr:ATP-dependent Clp protease ATP-binding subunit clpC [Hordeum vulgare]
MSSWSCPEGLFYFVAASAVASAAFTWATWALLEDHHDRLAYNQLRAGINPLDATGSLRTLVAAAADPGIGRDDEIDRVICILCRRTKNCAALVGPAGVGKTAIVRASRSESLPRFKDAIKQAEEAQGKVILFIDEMHMVVGAGGVDAANILKPALARGRIRCVGSTTSEEYQKYIQKDAALERRFQKVDVEEPSCMRPLPSCRDEAVNLVAQAVLHSRVGFGQSGQPISAFLFLGPLGVGKTELAKALAEKIFDNEKALIRFDMSEHAQSGYEEDGQLTEKVKRCPYSVILFEQVDIANDLVFKVFLQLLDDGMLTDGKGQVVDFKNTIIIMTSNLGAEQLTSRLTGKNTINAERDILMKQVKNRFKPEFINRLSQVVIFEPLSHSEMREIVKIQMKNVVATVANKGISLLTTDAALDFISSESHDLVHGARHIRRWVQNHVTTILSDMLVDGEACAGSTISIDAADDKRELTFQVLKKQQESWQINEMIFAVVTPMIDKEDA